MSFSADHEKHEKTRKTRFSRFFTFSTFCTFSVKKRLVTPADETCRIAPSIVNKEKTCEIVGHGFLALKAVRRSDLCFFDNFLLGTRYMFCTKNTKIHAYIRGGVQVRRPPRGVIGYRGKLMRISVQVPHGGCATGYRELIGTEVWALLVPCFYRTV